MPEPDNVTALKRFLAMVNYLSKFMPHLSKMTEPLRRLEGKDAEWQWLKQEEVTTQCGASETGLGVVLMQNGQPICYASRALRHRHWDKIRTDRERASCHLMVLSQIWPVHTWSWRRTHRFWPWATTGSIKEANTPMTKTLTENENGTAELFSGH